MAWLILLLYYSSYPTPSMDSQALAIAIDRLKFYAKDAAFTLSQVSPLLRA